MRWRRREQIRSSPYTGEWFTWWPIPGEWRHASYYGLPMYLNPHTRRDELCGDETHPGPPYKTGGPFDKRDYWFDGSDIKNVGVYQYSNYRYVGGFTAQNMYGFREGFNLASVLDPGSFGDVDSYGATAWNRFRPGRPAVDLGVSIAELRDLPRMLRTTARGFHDLWRSMGGHRTHFGPKKVADHWLNTQFGWVPFISDIRKLQRANRSVKRALWQLHRDNGKWVKRGGTVQEVESTEKIGGSETQTFHSPTFNSYYYDNPAITGRYSVFREKVSNVWFSARFRYWIPDVGTKAWYNRAWRAYYGLRMSPSLLWEITPWSWLVDWFSNTGDIISNLSNPLAENLVAKYAYVMGQTSEQVTVNSSHINRCGTQNASWQTRFVRKVRTAANPFGFGLSSDMLSAKQWSILSALGLSRL